MRTYLRSSMLFFVIALMICFCFGAMLYLERTAVQEPFLNWEYDGTQLSLTMVGEEYQLSLFWPERIAQGLQYIWILLPARWRLSLQLLTCLLWQ